MSGQSGAELSLLFVGSRRMQDLNSRYRGIDAVTDVLSFPLRGGTGTGDSSVLGDIVVCVPRVRKQAADYGVSFSAELRRMLVHGLLHLLGYDHEKGRYRRRKMELKEEEILDALASVD